MHLFHKDLPQHQLELVDVLRATNLPRSAGDDDRENSIGQFVTLRATQAGEVLRGVAFTPGEEDDEQ